MSKLSLTEIELDRLLVLNQIKSRVYTQEEAGKLLGLSTRQIRRLLKRLDLEGSEGVKSRHRGGNRTLTPCFKQSVMKVVKENYPDFGPTFASEKLKERESLKVSKETLRKWMIDDGLWKGRSRKQARIHQSRVRRPRFGELVQIDGSHHDWFEGRGPACCLLVFIDDATSKIITMLFGKSETTIGYMNLVQSHVQQYGRPLAYYSDKHSIFRTTSHTSLDRRIQDTQFHRALRSLQIELICAHSSQAKGRVERANKTLQDRLVKEMRLRKISTIEEANAFLPSFIEQYNQQFSVAPENAEDAHRPLYHSPDSLRRVLSIHTERKLSKNLEFSLNRDIYQIITPGKGYRLRHKTITICEHIDGSKEVWDGESSLEFRMLERKLQTPAVIDTKEIQGYVDELAKETSKNFMQTALNTSSTAPACL